MYIQVCMYNVCVCVFVCVIRYELMFDQLVVHLIHGSFHKHVPHLELYIRNIIQFLLLSCFLV